MSKQKVMLLAITAMFISYSAALAVPSGPFGYDLQADMHRSEKKNQQQTEEPKTDNSQPATQQVDITPKVAKDFYSFVPMKDLYVSSIDHSKYYSNPTMQSAIRKYKAKNYSGCLQELYSYVANPKHKSDAYAYYYMGLAYSKIGETTAAKNCFQKTINCNAKGKLFEAALKGRDCITGGTYCHTPVNPTANQLNKIQNADPLDAFINAPYSGNGFSPEAEKDYQQRQLNNIQKKINNKDMLNVDDIQSIQELDSQKKKVIKNKAVGFAAPIEEEPSPEQILQAIDILKRAGLNIAVDTNKNISKTNSTASNPEISKRNEYQDPSSYVNSDYQVINMMLGNGNNNNNDPMMNMLPYMLDKNKEGKNIDPQVIQSLMMNSMMNGLNGLNSADNR